MTLIAWNYALFVQTYYGSTGRLALKVPCPPTDIRYFWPCLPTRPGANDGIRWRRTCFTKPPARAGISFHSSALRCLRSAWPGGWQASRRNNLVNCWLDKQKINIEVDYVTRQQPSLERKLFLTQVLSTTLPVSVNVQDFFRGSRSGVTILLEAFHFNLVLE